MQNSNTIYHDNNSVCEDNDTNLMPDEFQKSIAYISATMEEL